MPIAALVLVVAALVAFWAWIVMVIWGALASALGFQTIGFGTAALVVLAVAVVGALLNKD